MNIPDIRSQFPSLRKEYNGYPVIYLDGPGGTQVPQVVIDAVSNYYQTSNANTHGFFPTSNETDEVMDTARSKMAEFLGAEGPETISFGQNMTTLNYSLSRALVRDMKAGDEILITQLDHEANRGPWLGLEEFGIVIKEVAMTSDCRVDMEDLASKINNRTRILAMGYASNAFGTINDLAMARKLSSEVGALLVVDAVHYAPHFPVDVQSLNCDFLLCSAYKFYGPHVGILYSKPGLLDSLHTDRLRTQSQKAPYRIETGTLNHAAIAGVTAAIDFIRNSGQGNDLHSAMDQIAAHEREVFRKLYEGLKNIPGLKIYGLGPDDARTPTVSFTLEGKTPEDICRILGEHSICAWDGHFYAIRAIEALKLLEQGGVTRMGVSIYTSDEDVERTLQVMGSMV